jgi:hypothetical protein
MEEAHGSLTPLGYTYKRIRLVEKQDFNFLGINY